MKLQRLNQGWSPSPFYFLVYLCPILVLLLLLSQKGIEVQASSTMPLWGFMAFLVGLALVGGKGLAFVLLTLSGYCDKEVADEHLEESMKDMLARHVQRSTPSPSNIEWLAVASLFLVSVGMAFAAGQPFNAGGELNNTWLLALVSFIVTGAYAELLYARFVGYAIISGPQQLPRVV